MIINHQYRFIFIKVNKTASTSIEIALSKFCSEDDVITPISSEDEKIRASLGYRGPQNCVGNNQVVFRNHSSAKEIVKGIDKDIWNSYYKFCFERNPWDRMISMYFWKNQVEPRQSMAEFLATKEARLLITNGRNLYTMDNQVAVDRVYFYENLKEELAQFCNHVGIPEPLSLPRAKSRFRQDRRSNTEFYRSQEILTIANMFAWEIKQFHYKP